MWEVENKTYLCLRGAASPGPGGSAEQAGHKAAGLTPPGPALSHTECAPRPGGHERRGPSAPAEVGVVTEGTSRLAFRYRSIDPEPSQGGQLNLAGQTVQEREKSHRPSGIKSRHQLEIFFTWLG